MTGANTLYLDFKGTTVKTFNPRNQQGLALIEAMVAFMVVTAGVLGVLKINATLLSNTGQSKARAEAVAIAQAQLERARDYNLQTACTDTVLDTPAETTINGVNEVFSLSSTFANSDADGWKDVSVCVRWRNGSCNPSVPGDRVLLNSRIACIGSGTSAQIGQGGAQNVQGGFIKTPAGRATTGTNIDYTAQDGDTTVGDPDTTFKTRTIRRANGDVILVATDTNKILLITKRLSCEASQNINAPDFSTISGRILLQANGNSPIIPAANLFPLISEGAVCRIDTANLSTNRVPSTGTPEYFWADYKCTVGAEWWGNIGVVSTEGGNSETLGKRACTGNSKSTAISNNIYSKHPQLSGARAYRGYRTNPKDDTKIETVGIGETDDPDTVCSITEGRNVYKNTSKHFANHNFAIWTISGTIEDRKCNTVVTENRVNSTPDSENPVYANGALVARRNPGKYYCMSNDDGVSCAYSTETGSSNPTTTIQGSIFPGTGSTMAIISAIEQPGADCTFSNLTPVTSGGAITEYRYSCTLNWSGNINAYPNGWNGAINFTTSDTLCAQNNSNTQTVISPSGYAAGIDINNTRKSLDLRNVDKAITNIQFDFTARKAGSPCPTTLTNN